MSNKHEFVDSQGVLREIPLPTDWSVTTEKGLWLARAHSKDGTIGVAETGFTKAEALEKLAKRMSDWLKRGFEGYGSGKNRTNYD